MYDYKEVEENVLKLWADEGIYTKAKKQVLKGKKFYFLDGPPYTSGKVHLGTAWNKSLKDCVLRYKRMRGFNVWDRAGYDMHGLPVENKVQAKLELKQKEDIVKFGVSKFMKECKAFAIENLELMNKDFGRLGVWMDFENAYRPVDSTYIEGEWWLIKKAHENKRLYEGLRTTQWCSSCETALSKHELEYENVSDNSIFVKLKVVGTNEYLIVWTTTPWTIPLNLAVMVNPEVKYVRAKVGSSTWIVAKDLVNSVMQKAGAEFKIESEVLGKDLEGLKYEHPFTDIDFSSVKGEKKHSVVLSSEYVNTESGTGLVHCAPGCGPEDFEVGHRNGLIAFNPLLETGKFPKLMGRFNGFTAKVDDKKFIAEIDSVGALVAKEKYDHDYAHCWRCKNPIIFRATSQWYFKVEDIRSNMRELNKEFEWIPDWAGSKQFDSWLENLRDNGITRQRFWGTPMPVWKCNDCGTYDVIGSVDELSKLGAKVPEDLHIPWIDKIEFKCKCGSVKKRVPDILDVWIDAGSASWNCLDYPRRTDLFKSLFPADFILEGKDQIRGWYNLLLVASMVSMMKPSFKTVYMHGFINDAKGRKMSKSLGNVISPYEVIDKYGADTFRHYMIGGAAPGVDLNYNFDDLKLKNRNLHILWNLHVFLIDLAKELSVNPTKVKLSKLDVEEKYILSKMNSTIAKLTSVMDKYELNQAPWIVESLFLELSRTYIQFVRDKSSIGSDAERETVCAVVYTVLLNSLTMLAPVAPFITEAIYQNLRNEFSLKDESVHLLKWPKHDSKSIDDKLENNMAVVASIIQSSLAGREKIKLGLRWPLKELIIVGDVKLGALKQVIENQVNVKSVKVMDSVDFVKVAIKPNFKEIGATYSDKVPVIVKAFNSLNGADVVADIKKKGKYVMKVGSNSFDILKEHIVLEREVTGEYVEVEFDGGFVYLDKLRNAELDGEGYAREIMRRVQNLRKTSGFVKTDRIEMFVQVSADVYNLVSKFDSAIAEKVGADSIIISESIPDKEYPFESKEKIKEKEVNVWIKKV